MYGYIKATTDDELMLIHQNFGELENEHLWKHIGGYYEIVAPAMLSYTVWNDVRILCDDCGLMREDPKINKLASALYGAPSPIVGDVLFVRQGFTEDGEADIFPFSDVDAEKLYDFLHRLLERLKTAKI